MRKTFLSAVAVAALMTLPSIATAGDNGWYARAGVGIGTLDDMTFSGGLNGTVDSASDIRPTLGFGKYLNDDGWRLDFDLTQRYNDTGLVGEHAFSDSGFNSWSVMANIIKDFDVGMAVKPYLGVGAGIADVDLSAHGFQNGVSLTDPYAIAHDSATTFAWNALVGLGWDLSDNLAFDLGYRYFQAQSLDFASSNGAIDTGHYQSHDVFAQFRLSFGATPPPPPPPPPPAPVCNDVAFPVYFDWDKSNLTTQAADAIAAGVARASRCGIASANVGGHADKSGNRKYNVGLSSRRANIVRGELVNRGVSGAVISTEAFGETAPAVQTPDGAREPLNRRAVVVLHAR